jgi:hypothetical protein
MLKHRRSSTLAALAVLLMLLTAFQGIINSSAAGPGPKTAAANANAATSANTMNGSDPGISTPPSSKPQPANAARPPAAQPAIPSSSGWVYKFATGAATFINANGRIDSTGCDNCTYTVTLPFPVTFYGNSFTSAKVSTNGNLQFSSNSSANLNLALPSATFNNLIAPYWDDITTSDNFQCPNYLCGIYVIVTGSAPNRQFTIEWRGAAYETNFTYVNFEIVFNESNAVITTNYNTVDGNGYGGNGSSSTVGVQEADGSGTNSTTQFSFDQAVISDGMRIDYFPIPPTFYGVSYYTFTGPAAPISGTLDIGNHGDNITTTVAFPFPLSFYGTGYTNGVASANGNIQFGSSSNIFSNSCLPSANFNNALMPYWADLDTSSPRASSPLPAAAAPVASM